MIPRFTSRRGFTITEASVVLVNVGLLTALLVPAIQEVRVSAGRAESANNLKQLALAFHSYHDAQKFLPYNGRNTDTQNFSTSATPNVLVAMGNKHPESGSWGYQILPYIQKADVYDLADGSTTKQEAMAKVTRIPVLLCPNRNRPGVASDPKGFPGYPDPSETVNSSQTYIAFGPQTDYALNPYINAMKDKTQGGAPNIDNAKSQLTDIKDGTSNTILLGQGYMRTEEYKSTTSNGWKAPINAGGTSATARGLGNIFLRDDKYPYNPCSVTPYNGVNPGNGQANIAQVDCTAAEINADTAKELNWFKTNMTLKPDGNNSQRSFFGGPFEEGGLFVFADGSVHLIPYDFNSDTGNGGTGKANLTQLLVTNDGTIALPKE